MIDRRLLCTLDKRVSDRYSIRLREFGVGPRALGWDRTESQLARFVAATRFTEFVDRSVLDIGCGFADFASFLHADASRSPLSYSGIDINPEMIDLCRQHHPNANFQVRNILSQPYSNERWDIVTMFGLLNLKLSEFSNEDYAHEFIAEAFKICKEVLIVDMLSACNDANYPTEDFVHYYRPSEMLDFALRLTPHVSLLHDYQSIPQREFMLFLKKSPCE